MIWTIREFLKSVSFKLLFTNSYNFCYCSLLQTHTIGIINIVPPICLVMSSRKHFMSSTLCSTIRLGSIPIISRSVLKLLSGRSYKKSFILYPKTLGSFIFLINYFFEFFRKDMKAKLYYGFSPAKSGCRMRSACQFLHFIAV